MDDAQESRSFEKAKVWSDYLGFHLRALIFLTLALACGRVGIGTIGLEIEEIWAKVFVIVTSLIASAAFFAFAAVMLVRITSVNIDYWFDSVYDQAPKTRSRLLFFAILILQFGIQAAMLVSLLSIASIGGFT